MLIVGASMVVDSEAERVMDRKVAVGSNEKEREMELEGDMDQKLSVGSDDTEREIEPDFVPAPTADVNSTSEAATSTRSNVAARYDCRIRDTYKVGSFPLNILSFFFYSIFQC